LIGILAQNFNRKKFLSHVSLLLSQYPFFNQAKDYLKIQAQKLPLYFIQLVDFLPKHLMEVYLHFKEVNSDYSQAVADEFNDGQESEENIKYMWEDELKVTDDVVDFKIRNKAIYTLKGAYADGTSFSFDIPDMSICECKTASGNIIQFAVSGKIIKNTDKKTSKDGKEIRFTYFLKDQLPVENPFPGVYILAKDFPRELKGQA
jgi:hypothetical protein